MFPECALSGSRVRVRFFPATSHDDIVDSAVHALNYLRPAPTDGLIEYYRLLAAEGRLDAV